MVRGALRALLAMEDDIQVVGEVARADEVVAAALACRPDIALMDIEMPGGDGISAAAALHEEYSAACGSRSAEEVAQSPLLRFGIGAINTSDGVLLFLTPEAASSCSRRTPSP